MGVRDSSKRCDALTLVGAISGAGRCDLSDDCRCDRLTLVGAMLLAIVGASLILVGAALARWLR